MALPRLRKKVKRMDVGAISLVNSGAEANSDFIIAQAKADAADAEDEVLAICQDGYDALSGAEDQYTALTAIEAMAARLRLLVRDEPVAQSDDPVAQLRETLTGWENHLGFSDHVVETVKTTEDAQAAIAQYAAFLLEEIGVPVETIAQAGDGTASSHEELDEADSATDVEGAEADTSANVSSIGGASGDTGDTSGADGAGGEDVASYTTTCPNCHTEFEFSRDGAPSGHGDADARGDAALGVAQSEGASDVESEKVTEEVVAQASDDATEETSQETSQETSEEVVAQEESDEEIGGVSVIEQPTKRFRSKDAQLWGDVFAQTPRTASVVAQAEADADENDVSVLTPEPVAQTVDLAALVAAAVEKATAPLVARIEELSVPVAQSKATPKVRSRQIDGEPTSPVVSQSKSESVWQAGPLSRLFG